MNPGVALLWTQSIGDHSTAKEEVAATTDSELKPKAPEAKATSPEVSVAEPQPMPKPTPDAFLSPLTIDEHNDPVGPCPSESGDCCSDK